MLDRRRRGWSQRVPTDALQFHDLARERAGLLAFASLYVVASAATALLIQWFPLPIWGASEFLQDFWYTGVFKIGLLLILPLWLHRRWGYHWTAALYGWRATAWSTSVVAACFAAGVVVNWGRVDEVAAGWVGHGAGESLARVALGVAFAFLNAGIPEEFVYRGLLQTRLEASWGRVAAVVVSVAFFVAWHLPTRYVHAHGVEGQAGDLVSVLLGTGVPVGIVGLIFALAWDRWRNLPALIAIHAGIDTIPIVSSMLQQVAAQFR